MEELFARILNMSITGTVVICFVLLAKLGMGKMPKVFSYALWSVVLFRLLCPVSISVDFSLFRLAEIPVTEVGGTATTVDFITEEQVYPLEGWKKIPDAAVAEPESAVVLPLLWGTGVVLMAMWGLWSLKRLKGQLREAAPLDGNVWECDGLGTAFVLGLAWPRIYLPSGLAAREREFILLHERHHVKRLDHVWKLAAYIALCLHWFNPLVWLAFYLGQRDMEMSCDEAVLKQLGQEWRCDYSQTLLRFSSGRRWTGAVPLAFGEGNVKERVINVLNWKKPRKWASAVCGLVCAGVLAACGGNPGVEPPLTADIPVTTEGVDREQMEQQRQELEEQMKEAEIRYRQEVTKVAYTVDLELTEFANIRLKLPSGWVYTRVEPELETSAWGIRFWPTECPEVQIELCYHPTGFGVCGTGLTSCELETDCGEKAELGFYDGNDAMSFCAYGMNYAAVNVSTVDKWEEYGDTILAILKSVELNRGVLSEQAALEAIRDYVSHEWSHYRADYDIESGCWTFSFYEESGGAPVAVMDVDWDGCFRTMGVDGKHHSGEGHGTSGHHHNW